MIAEAVFSLDQGPELLSDQAAVARCEREDVRLRDGRRLIRHRRRQPLLHLGGRCQL